jgi:hypothetical protein
MHWPITVASFRTWRGSQDYIARDPAPDILILTFEPVPFCSTEAVIGERHRRDAAMLQACPN